LIETLARRWYRFIAPVVQEAAPQSDAQERAVPAVTARSSVAVRGRRTSYCNT
jgi:hypothetical protein